jgi:hypothetical protein
MEKNMKRILLSMAIAAGITSACDAGYDVDIATKGVSVEVKLTGSSHKIDIAADKTHGIGWENDEWQIILTSDPSADATITISTQNNGPLVVLPGKKKSTRVLQDKPYIFKSSDLKRFKKGNLVAYLQ